MNNLFHKLATAAEEDEVLRDAVNMLLPAAASPTGVGRSTASNPNPSFVMDKHGNPIVEGGHRRPVVNALEVLLAAGLSKQEDNLEKDGTSPPEMRLFPRTIFMPATTVVANYALRVLREGEEPQNLYLRGVLAREREGGRAEMILKKRADAEQAQCSFKPEISEKSSGMAQSKLGSGGFYAAGLSWKKAVAKKMDRKKQKEDADKAEEDVETYRPHEISRRSAQLAAQKKQRLRDEYKGARQDYLQSLQQQQDEEEEEATREQIYGADDVTPSREQRPPVVLDNTVSVPGVVPPPKLWDPRPTKIPPQYSFSPTVNLTSSAIHEGRVEQGSKPLSVQERLVLDAAQRHNKKCAEEEIFSKEGFAAVLREKTPAKSPREVSAIVDRLEGGGTPRVQRRVNTSVEFSFQPQINPPYKEEDPLELEELLRDLEISSNTHRQRREAASAKNTKLGEGSSASRLKTHFPIAQPSEEAAAAPPITEEKLNTFLMRNKLYQLEKEAKCKTQAQVDLANEMHECSFVPKITQYPLSEQMYESPPLMSSSADKTQYPQKPRSGIRHFRDSSSLSSLSTTPAHNTSTTRSGSFPTRGVRRALGSRTSSRGVHHDPSLVGGYSPIPHSHSHSQQLHLNSASSPKVFVSNTTPCHETLVQEHYSFIHDPEFKQEFRSWFSQLDPDRCGWISPYDAWGAVKELGAQLGVQPQYVDVEGEFPQRLHFTDFVLLLSRAIRIPSMSSKR